MLTLVPLRLLLLVIIVLPYYILAISWLTMTPDRPWAHRVSICALRLASRLVLFAMGFWRIQVSGKEYVGRKGDPRVFVSNHISYVEILYFMAEFGASFVMKRTCLNVPIIGKVAMIVLDSVSVDNKGEKAGGSGFDAIAKRLDAMFGCEEQTGPEEATGAVGAKAGGMTETGVESTGWRGNPLVIFAEGTTSNGGCLLRFKTGIFAAGARPVHPVVLQFPFSRFSPAYESIPTHTHILRLLSEPFNTLTVKFLPRHEPTPAEVADPVQYAKAVQAEMSEALGGLHTVEAGYAQKMEYHKYIRQKYSEHPWGFLAPLLVVDPIKRTRGKAEKGD
ncbi:unnamed protein product [Choristocarpus tenellus]